MTILSPSAERHQARPRLGIGARVSRQSQIHPSITEWHEAEYPAVEYRDAIHIGVAAVTSLKQE